jgi:ferredoxin
MGGGSMTEMTDKKGRLKLTVEIEVNEELMDMAKDAMAKMPQMMMKRGENKQQ